MFIILQIFFATSGIRLPVRHMSTRQGLSIGFQNRVIQYSFPEFRTDFASVKRTCLGKKYNISVKGKHTFLIVWIQETDRGGYDLQSQSFFREQDQRELMRRFLKTCNDPGERNSRHFVALVLSSRVQLEQYFILKIQL